MYGALASALLTFIVFVFTMLLVAVQLASAQLSPRIIATAFRDRVIKFALTVLEIRSGLGVAVYAALPRRRDRDPPPAARRALPARVSAKLC